MNVNVQAALKALNRHGFSAQYCADATTAKKLILGVIPAAAKVGIPGSKTIRQLGLDSALRERGQITFDHWLKGMTDEQILEARRAQLTCDVLLTSSNAVTEQGEVYNMDGMGNRVAPMIWGPPLVIIAVGINKLVPDLEAARERLRKIAAPRRARELNLAVPCTKMGECGECNARERICRAELILHRAPFMTDYKIYIIGEELGN